MNEDVKTIRATSAQLWGLTLVCQEWRSLFTPSLYEAIAVSGLQLSALLDTLVSSESRPDLCQHVRALNVNLEDLPTQSCARFVKLLTSLPRLSTFSYKSGFLAWDVFSIIVTSCVSSLRGLTLYNVPEDPFRYFADVAPQLEYLGVMGDRQGVPGIAIRKPKVKLPRLHTFHLRMHCNPRWLTALLGSIDMPAIRTFILGADQSGSAYTFKIPRYPTLEVLHIASLFSDHVESVRANAGVDTLVIHSSNLWRDPVADAVLSRCVVIKAAREVDAQWVCRFIRTVKANGCTRSIRLYGCEAGTDWTEARELCGDVKLRMYDDELV